MLHVDFASNEYGFRRKSALCVHQFILKSELVFNLLFEGQIIDKIHISFKHSLLIVFMNDFIPYFF